MSLQVVGEKLSLHVLANYEEFVRGVNEVASIEKDLQVCICFIEPGHALEGLPVAVVGMLRTCKCHDICNGKHIAAGAHGCVLVCPGVFPATSCLLNACCVCAYAGKN